MTTTTTLIASEERGTATSKHFRSVSGGKLGVKRKVPLISSDCFRLSCVTTTLLLLLLLALPASLAPHADSRYLRASPEQDAFCRRSEPHLLPLCLFSSVSADTRFARLAEDPDSRSQIVLRWLSGFSLFCFFYPAKDVARNARTLAQRQIVTLPQAEEKMSLCVFDCVSLRGSCVFLSASLRHMGC